MFHIKLSIWYICSKIGHVARLVKLVLFANDVFLWLVLIFSGIIITAMVNRANDQQHCFLSSNSSS